ncbi:hypothetical protein BYT27DRAFT_7020503, partial [Phlegmacium glaucopus]
YHESVVGEMLEQMSENLPFLTVDKRIKVLRDRSIKWLWKAYGTINNKDLVK